MRQLMHHFILHSETEGSGKKTKFNASDERVTESICLHICFNVSDVTESISKTNIEEL